MLKLAKTSAPNNQVAVYTGGRQLEWREVESGQLPSPRNRMRAVMMDNQIFVTGGQEDRDDDWIDLTSILSWDPSTESWHEAGNLAVARSLHGAVAVPSSFVESECSAMLSV